MSTATGSGHRCANCARTWDERDLNDVDDWYERVSPGEPCPSGQCPECGALCHPDGSDEAERAEIAVELYRQLEALAVQLRAAGLIVPPGVTTVLAEAKGRLG